MLALFHEIEMASPLLVTAKVKITLMIIAIMKTITVSALALGQKTKATRIMPIHS